MFNLFQNKLNKNIFMSSCHEKKNGIILAKYL